MLTRYVRGDDAVTFTDMFCGAGGSSIGLTNAGMTLVTAMNHWQRAIETHSANFRDAEHLCEDVNRINMRRLPRTRVLWASPICTEASPAGARTGAKRKREVPGQQSLLEEEGHVEQKGYEQTRATFYDVLRAVEVHRYDAVLVENVPGVAFKWALFDWWLRGMCEQMGYDAQLVSVDAAHVHGEGGHPAPQWRGRLKMVFTREGIPAPDLAPRPLAHCQVCGQNVHGERWWKPAPRNNPARLFGPRQQRVGEYRRQYLYRCPRCQHVVEPYVLPAAAAIDWTDLGQLVGDRLVRNTRARIAAGLRMLAADPQAFMVNTNHDDTRIYVPTERPLPTRTAKIGDGLAVPLPFVTVLRNNARPGPVTVPLATVTAGGNHHMLTTPPGAFYVKNYGGQARPQDMARPVGTPFGTVTTSDHHALVVPYYRTGVAKSPLQPMDAVTTHDRFNLVNVTDPGRLTDADLDELVSRCLYRMVQPREHLRAQVIPDDYTVLGNKGEQTAQAGNAVPANVSHWIGERLMEALAA